MPCACEHMGGVPSTSRSKWQLPHPAAVEPASAVLQDVSARLPFLLLQRVRDDCPRLPPRTRLSSSSTPSATSASAPATTGWLRVTTRGVLVPPRHRADEAAPVDRLLAPGRRRRGGGQHSCRRRARSIRATTGAARFRARVSLAAGDATPRATRPPTWRGCRARLPVDARRSTRSAASTRSSSVQGGGPCVRSRAAAACSTCRRCACGTRAASSLRRRAHAGPRAFAPKHAPRRRCSCRHRTSPSGEGGSPSWTLICPHTSTVPRRGAAVDDLAWRSRPSSARQPRRDARLARLGPARRSRLLRGGLPRLGSTVRLSGARVVHAHNVHPAFGWRALPHRATRAPVVLHLTIPLCAGRDSFLTGRTHALSGRTRPGVC